MNNSQTVVNQQEARILELTEALALAQDRGKRQELELRFNRELNQILAGASEVSLLTEQVANSLKGNFGFQAVSIFLVDPSGTTLLPDSKAKSELFQAEPLISQVMRTKQPAHFPSADSKNTEQVPQLQASRAEIALPLIAEDHLIGLIWGQKADNTPFEKADIAILQPFSGPIATAIKKAQVYAIARAEQNKSSLIYEASLKLGTALDFEAITTIAVNLATRLEATAGNIHLLAHTGEIHFKSSYAKANDLSSKKHQDLIRRILTEGLEAWVLENEQAVLIPDVQLDERWLPLKKQKQPILTRSIICAPIILERGLMKGVISFIHREPDYFDEQDLAVLKIVAAQISVALENTILFKDIENNLYEANLMAEISGRLVEATSLKQMYTALVDGAMKNGVDRAALYICEDLTDNNPTQYYQLVFATDADSIYLNSDKWPQIDLAENPALENLVQSKEALTFFNIAADQNLTKVDRQFLATSGTKSAAIIPLVLRDKVIGMLLLQHRSLYLFTERELALYETLCNQAVAVLDNTRQRRQTEIALAETQILYRAGRVLAGTTNLPDILREALIDFLYSLGLDQGGITLLSPDRKYGELVAYVQDGHIQELETHRIEISDNISYQQILLSGYPFTSYDVAADPRLTAYQNFNNEKQVKSLLEAPMIIHGETIGWIGADAVNHHRDFSQREIDLVRAMADQIAIAIQNHQLLERSRRQAEQLKSVAEVGKSVSQLVNLDDILSSTVDLIRDRFGFYHVSIFLLDEAREWAVVRASTGDVGKIMVERPHQLKVGGQSIVGYVTGCGEPRIALDVGEDAVHFNNPLLPKTHSEMALPLISAGKMIGALDVQSIEVDAFNQSDVDTLQVMADQLTAALENARLLKTAQESETFLKAVINQIPDPIFIKNKEHQWVAANKSFCEDLMGLTEEQVIGYSDYDYVPKEQADWFWEQDNLIFVNNMARETEEVITDSKGNNRILFTRKIPLTIQENTTTPDYLIGVIHDITERKQYDTEREKLIEETRRNLERTQSLYRVSQALTAVTDPQTAFETVLGEHIRLLGVEEGSLMLADPTGHFVKTQARYIGGQSIEPRLVIPILEDLIFQHLIKHPKPLIIEDAQNDPRLKRDNEPRSKNIIKSMLFIPLIIQGKVLGSLVADSFEAKQIFTHDDIEIGEAIAGQLSIRLESLQFLAEAQYKTTLLQTAAEVSHAASSILDTGQLIKTSVNLIRDKFELYYVGLFLVDELNKWAVLRAGTGEAGRLQIEANHKLEIGGSSMIGASLQNRSPRISMDVGGETEFFKNKYLPDTRSELALPLFSQGEAVGALTVQSVKPNAFSDEDITVLQTMADQLANALATARLFETVARAQREAEHRLRETVALQRFSQALASTRHVNEILEILFDACVKTIGFDYVQLALVDKNERVKAVAGVGINEEQIKSSNQALDSQDIMADIIRTGRTEVIFGWDNRLNSIQFDQQKQETWIRVFTPITLRQNRVGLVEAGFYNTVKQDTVTEEQIRLLQAFIDQAALALDNAQRYETSHQAAQREIIIREITSKIHEAVDIDDILQITIAELSQVLGTPRGAIRLGMPQSKASGESKQDLSPTNGQPTLHTS